MSAVHAQYQKRAFYQRGVLACRKCGAPIYVHKLAGLPDEISLRCARCGDRGLYAARAIAIQDVPERRRKPRR